MRATKRALLATAAIAAAALMPATGAVAQNSFTGFFVGLNGGYGFNDVSGDSSKARAFTVPQNGLNALNVGGANTAGTLSITGDKGKDGFVGGGQAGYNYQYGYFVYGVETDLQYVGFGKSKPGTATYTVTGTSGGVGIGAKVGTQFPLVTSNAQFVDAGNASLDYYGSFRGKLGYAFDRATLLYLTGGIAYGGGTSRTVIGNSNDINVGYAAGGGLEYMFTPSLSGQASRRMYVSIDQGDGTNFACCVRSNTGSINAIPVTGGHSQDTDFALARVGLNYKFGAY